MLKLEKLAVSRLTQLNDAYKNYVKALEEVGQLLRIYDVRLYGHLAAGVAYGKSGLWHEIIEKIDLSMK